MGDDTASARQRLEVLQLAEELGNVAEACRRSGMDRTSFYQWKRRYAEHGLDGLVDLPPIHKSHPMATPESLAETIVAVALEHPSYGCDRLKATLAAGGRYVSAVTIQKILKNAGLGTQHDRWLALDKPVSPDQPPLTPEQSEFIEHQNPCFRDRANRPKYPVQIIAAGAFPIGPQNSPNKLFAHAAIDSYSNSCSVFLSSSRGSRATTEATRAMYFACDPYWRRPYPILVMTCRSFRFVDAPKQPFRAFLASSPLTHKMSRRTTDFPPGCLQRFHVNLTRELHPAHEVFLGPFENIAGALAEWCASYNTARRLPGYPNYGRTPLQMLDLHARKEA